MDGPRIGSSPGRGARRILVAVALCGLVLAGLAVWVLLVPVRVSHPEWNGGRSELGCHTLDSVDVFGFRAEAEALCDEAEEERRNAALIAGGVAVTVAFAVSTWPSRRLTGEALGPLR